MGSVASVKSSTTASKPSARRSSSRFSRLSSSYSTGQSMLLSRSKPSTTTTGLVMAAWPGARST